jgi:predicted O-methyltransferase YrrM
MITDKLKHEIADMISLKRRPIIEGWMEQPKGEVLAGMVIDHKPQLLVEIGVFGGRSMFAQAFALRENGMGVIWGIDPWSLDAALEGDIGDANKKWWTENINIEDIYLGFVRGVLDFQLSRWIRWIRERSEFVAPLFKDKTVDVVHIDGNHSELCSCRDVGVWNKKIKPGGFLIMDDVQWDTVTKALKMVETLKYKEVMRTMEFAVFQKPNGTA